MQFCNLFFFFPPKICAAEFKEFVERLKVKFSTKMDDPAYAIPETVDELFNR